MTNDNPPPPKPSVNRRNQRLLQRRLIRRIEVLVFLLSVMVALAYVFSNTPPSELARIKASGTLVVATRNGPTTYYQGPSGPTGFEYDLVEAFARYLGVKVRWVFPHNGSNILSMVEYGRVELAAAGIAKTPQREQAVRFGPTYQTITQQVIYLSGRRRPRSVKDLIGKTITVLANSSFSARLQALKKKYPGLSWRTSLNTSAEELLYRVYKGQIDYTIDDSNDFMLNRRYYPQLVAAFNLGKPQQLAWAMRKNGDNSLYDATVKFFAKIKKDGTLHRITERYYGHVRNYDYVGTFTFMKYVETRLPKWIPLFKAAGKKYHINWRLLAAQSYQESHWNPNAVSPTGVRGLMMLTPPTAAHLGVKNLVDPEESVMGGAAYLDEVLGWIPQSVKEPDRMWFALASYNVGFGHILDAMAIARKLGKNPNSWTAIKDILPLLTQRKWYSLTRNGYARGREAVTYVQNIRSYYDILMWLKKHRDGQSLKQPLPSSLQFLPPSL